jgi:hypothetical protein
MPHIAMKHAMLNSVATISGSHVSRQRDLQLQSFVLMPLLRLVYWEAIDKERFPG